MLEAGRAGRMLAACLAACATGVLIARATPAAEPVVAKIDVATQKHSVQISILLSEPTPYRAYLLGGPFRLVVDLPRVEWKTGTGEQRTSGPLSAWRFGGLSSERTRLVFDLDRPMRIKSAAQSPVQEGWIGRRLVIELDRVANEDFARAAREQHGTLPILLNPGHEERIMPMGPADAPLIVLDPGHGGIDPGASGPGGTFEKDIVLTMARELRDVLIASGRFRVMLTRGGDHHVALRDRYEMARKYRAHTFLSLHADANPLRSLRGISVYTLSATASDAAAAALAKRENRADAVSGVDLSHNTERVAGILIDLAQRQALHNAARLAVAIVPELARVAELVPGRARRAAGFAVLKAPDVPSVLIELGHLSNAREELRLGDAAYRQRLALGILRGLDRYVSETRRQTSDQRGEFTRDH